MKCLGSAFDQNISKKAGYTDGANTAWNTSKVTDMR